MTDARPTPPTPPAACAVHWRCLPFDALLPASLYALLRLRSEVFVVEQACAFQDLDGLDTACLHVLGEVAQAAHPAPAVHAAPGVAAPPGRTGAATFAPGAGLCANGARLVAGARLVPPGLAFAEASIGRVVTAPQARAQGLGHALMRESLRLLTQLWGPQPVRIGAQAHLQDFYRRHGFVTDSAPYDEDGIAHVEMIRPPMNPTPRRPSP